MYEKYFENVENVGDLYLEKTFVQFEDENILFVCRTKSGERYLGVCYEVRLALKWILCKISNGELVQILQRNITIRECFERKEVLLHIIYTGNSEQSQWLNQKSVDRRILPDIDYQLKYNDAEKDPYYWEICMEMLSEVKKQIDSMLIKMELSTEDIENDIIKYNDNFEVKNRIHHQNAEWKTNSDWLSDCA